MGSHVYNVVKAPIGWSLVCHRERIGGYVSSQAALEAATAHGAKALREGHSIQRVRRRFHTAKSKSRYSSIECFRIRVASSPEVYETIHETFVQTITRFLAHVLRYLACIFSRHTP